MKSLIKLITVLTTITALVFFFGCEKQSPVSSMETDQFTGSQSYGKKPGTPPVTYPQFGTYTYTFWNAQNGYRGGTLNLDDGSILVLEALSLTPPPEIPWGDDVTITMLIEKDSVNNELIFTFGPHGCQFNNPPARVFLNYKELGIEVPVLYYIDENGNYIQQQPDDVDVTNRNIILYLDHFSRYAIGAE